jgi:3-oxoacyl-[acyl-carrier protein] reductase
VYRALLGAPGVSVEDKVILITGASVGIGRGAAIGLGERGAMIGINYRSHRAEAESALAEIRQAGGEGCLVGADVSNPQDVKRMVETVRETFGRIDVLINNAGVYPRQPFAEMTFEDWHRIIDVNLNGCYHTCREVLPEMVERGYGKIINVSTVCLTVPQADMAHYLASKGGIVGLTRALAREYGPHGVRVNAVAPGAILVEEELRWFPDQQAVLDKCLAVQSLKYRGLPEHLVGTFAFLASQDSDFITGQTILVDGGWAQG